MDQSYSLLAMEMRGSEVRLRAGLFYLKIQGEGRKTSECARVTASVAYELHVVRMSKKKD